ncbi:MAG: alkaline phosphatase family protein [Pseudomonadota bacterium]
MLDQIRHVVVLMLENRSFDNILGGLYGGGRPSVFVPPSNTDPVDGIVDANGTVKASCRNPSNPAYLVDPDGHDPRWVQAKLGVAGSILHNLYVTPYHDPDELFDHMTFQIFGRQQVDAGARPEPSMDGFWVDFRNHHPLSLRSTIDQIMESFSPVQLPIISGLAQGYAVSDRWFASCPTQTYPNRAFVNAGTSLGFVNNDQSHTFDTPTIYNWIEEGNRRNGTNHTFGVYYGDYSITWLTLPQARQTSRGDAIFQRHEAFFEALQGPNPTLPTYTFLEPNYIIEVESEHPPFNVARGEGFLAEVYSALAGSPIWDNLLFVVTYDEHGGCYDHVPPPWGAIPPDDHTQEGFGFDRFGVRVPTVFVSPYIAEGTVIRSSTDQPFDHCSLLKTIGGWLGLPPEGLPSARVNAEETPTFENVLTSSTPRQPVGLHPPPPVHGGGDDSRPIGALQSSIVASVAAQRHEADPSQPTSSDVTSRVTTVADAIQYLGLSTQSGTQPTPGR